jgi:MarR family transcriptional regulator, organic hydroperoxide resistance regulator
MAAPTSPRSPRSAQAARGGAADEAWGLLHRLMLSQRRRFVAVAAELDLHPAQAGALLAMQPDTPVPMHELATMLHCDNSNVTGIVDRLEARGLVARRPHERDRRVKHVVLTPLGVAASEQVRATMASAPEVLRKLPVADQRALRDILRSALEDAE